MSVKKNKTKRISQSFNLSRKKLFSKDTSYERKILRVRIRTHS